MVTARTIAFLMLTIGTTLATQPPAPLVIAHRGASGHRPEHTIEAYTLAIAQGADAIEPDLVSTKDGVLIARHENEIGGTTDVAVKFPDRRTTKQIDGDRVTGWFSEDFTLAEIQTLRARERLAFRSHAYDGRFAIPTFADVLALAEAKSRETGRSISVYPETKHPSYFRSIGLPLEEQLIALLAARGLTEKTSPVFIQSFEPSSLRRMRSRPASVSYRLTSAVEDVTTAGLAGSRNTPTGGGGETTRRAPWQPTESPSANDARRRRARGRTLHSRLDASQRREFSRRAIRATRGGSAQFMALGVDGVFTDFPDVAADILKAGRALPPGEKGPNREQPVKPLRPGCYRQCPPPDQVGHTFGPESGWNSLRRTTSRFPPLWTGEVLAGDREDGPAGSLYRQRRWRSASRSVMPGTRGTCF
jgi:glycerophosphoryl diester phosphodiesterase